MFPIELFGIKTNPAKSAWNLGVIVEKISPFAHIYQQSVAHAFAICGICSVFAVTLIWMVQNYLQLLLCPNSESHWTLRRTLVHCKKTQNEVVWAFKRALGLAKTVLQGTLWGGRRNGGQRKRWEDNIRNWTGLELSDVVRRAEEREEWRMLVARSCGAPTVPKNMG